MAWPISIGERCLLRSAFDGPGPVTEISLYSGKIYDKFSQLNITQQLTYQDILNLGSEWPDDMAVA